MVKLVHYKDSLMLSEVVSCSGIELNFKGKFISNIFYYILNILLFKIYKILINILIILKFIN